MRASDLETSRPVVDRHTTALEAARLIAGDRLAGLVVADESGVPVAVVSAVDVLALMVPGYVLDDMSLAGVFDERGAEEVWAHVAERTIGELLDDDSVRVYDILEVDADATLIEVAAQMADAHSQIALVRREEKGEPRFVALASVMDAILRFADRPDERTPGA